MHAFAEASAGRRLRLGGVDIDYPQGLAGHSDADVVVHAIADAILGAARLEDIGHHFPDSDPAYSGIDSLILLSEVRDKIAALGYQVLDIDCVIMAERPRLAGYRDAMREAMAQALGLDRQSIGIKATTHEGLGAIGRGEGIAATAVALLQTKDID